MNFNFVGIKILKTEETDETTNTAGTKFYGVIFVEILFIILCDIWKKEGGCKTKSIYD